MVEMTRTLMYKFSFLLCAGLLAAAGLGAQQPRVEARIAGLEDNEEYMSLLDEDARLQNREDSVVRAVEGLRRRLREEPAERVRFSQEILDLENRIFEIRNAKGRLVDRINSIEQEWVLANLDQRDVRSDEDAAGAPAAVPDSLKVRNLVDNPCFREELAPEDYAALQRAQRMEMQAVDFVNRYFSNYSDIADLADAYRSAQNEEEALDIHERFEVLQRLNRVLADSLARTWNYIFDNKSYAYGYLLDKMGREEILAREEERLAEAARELTALRGRTASDQVADYFLRKRVSVDYETALAGVLELDAARDSLEGVSAQLAAVEFRLPEIEIAERSFIVYDSVAFSATPKYSYQHPIPQCSVYAHGTVYRILLGTFNTKRAASTFRGAYPLCYRIDEGGKWCYYAGGFATRAEAEAAQQQLKARGFVRPEIVVWNDGVYRNLSREPERAAVAYRVEITGAETLSEALKACIRTSAEGAELSRVGPQLFVVGSFDDKAAADRLAGELRQTDGSLEIKVAEISE